MSARLRYTILGCGSSGGVPRLGGHWGDCDPSNPKNTRRRCSMLVERVSQTGTTRVLIDAGPDMRAQLVDAGIGELDAVAFTHSHADHIHGLDDLRQIVFNISKRLPVWADARTAQDLRERFAYAFIQPAGSPYPPILDLYEFSDQPIIIDGKGGVITLFPFPVQHGSIQSFGFRIGGLAYLPDVSAIPEGSWAVLNDLDIWVLDALRRRPHSSHAHLDLSLKWIARARPGQGILTNMHLDMDYQTVLEETPQNVVPAYDGMVLELAAE